MIRMTLALLATMFLTFVIAGDDRGQVRYGLQTTDSPDPTDVSAIAVEPVSNVATAVSSKPLAKDETAKAVYLPAEAVVVVTDPAPEPQPTAATQTTTTETLVEAEKLVRFVAVSTANVREGPSKDFSVIDKLSRGEAVTVVSATDDPDGWTLIRIEGDGLEGYVSNALLSDQP